MSQVSYYPRNLKLNEAHEFDCLNEHVRYCKKDWLDCNRCIRWIEIHGTP